MSITLAFPYLSSFNEKENISCLIFFSENYLENCGIVTDIHFI